MVCGQITENACYSSVELHDGRKGGSIPKSSEEHEVGMVGLRMQDMVGDVG